MAEFKIVGFCPPQQHKFTIAENGEGKIVEGNLSSLPSMMFDPEISKGDFRYLHELLESKGEDGVVLMNRVNAILKSMRRGARIKNPKNNLMKAVSRRRKYDGS